MIIILGPAVCIGCDAFVWWATFPAGGRSASKAAWRNESGRIHLCPGRRVR